jgi:hypothetical protein
LKTHRSTGHIGYERIFEQDQIARAVELGLGAHDASKIENVPADDRSKEVADRNFEVLSNG